MAIDYPAPFDLVEEEPTQTYMRPRLWLEFGSDETRDAYLRSLLAGAPLYDGGLLVTFPGTTFHPSYPRRILLVAP
ncbi:MAG TPA: hypothetical protein VGN72_01160 [Tepidisphaeraceae bacterium]|nr:hypothetical protein [Tepidisphaeraceae bacterium]